MFWREPDDLEWKKVKGLGALHNCFYKPIPSSHWDPSPCNEVLKGHSKLRTFGTNILIFWFKYNPKNTKVDIWCDEISFERRHDIGEIVGKIEWLQSVAGVKGHPSSHHEDILLMSMFRLYIHLFITRCFIVLLFFFVVVSLCFYVF